jgi:DNA-binding NtrC family response regulator
VKFVNWGSGAESTKILVVDDELSVRNSLVKWFEDDGYTVGAAADASEALNKLTPGVWDIVFLDIKLPDMDGLELQHRIRSIDPRATIIMITAYASIDTAVKSLKAGAYDYVTKPVDPDFLSYLVADVIQHRSRPSADALQEERIQGLYEVDQLVGESPTMARILEMVESVAATDTTVMIKGETGTGKEMIARAIHSKSLRRFYPFVTVNCGTLIEGSAESGLFGREPVNSPAITRPQRGKLEIANGGTVFLDEIGNLDARSQEHLLQVIDAGQFTRVGGNRMVKVDCRFICATNRDLQLAVKEGRFREDLFYKVNAFSITVPPLRERASDIPLFCNYFLRRIAGSMNRPVSGFSPEAWDRLKGYDWPGNVRELRNAIERAIVVAQGSTIAADELPIPSGPRAVPQDTSLEAVEKAHIEGVLERMRWNITRSAQMLGINRVTLHNKMKKYGLRRKP